MKKYSILVVDDEENVSKLLFKVLKKEGYTVYTASNAESALEIIDKNNIDIAISDIRMPGISGIDLLGKIKEIDQSIKVIMITAFATVETAIEALRKGASDYITKPFDLDEILLSVNKITESNEVNDTSHDSLKTKDDKMENYIITKSDSMLPVIELIKQVAETKSTVIIYGETGTGKELAAQAIHNCSSRKDNTLIKVNCAAIPENLLESELFGYEKGAFTGAVCKKPGRFELAQGGSIFLDEIGDISAAMQVKLLRVLQEREFERLGGTKTYKLDVRVIAATNKSLEEQVKKGLFREDLYYRLNVVPISLPPLRERKEDIELLVDHFLEKSSFISGKTKKIIAKNALEKLINYNWPGNIRELENIIERCVVVTRSDIIDLENLPKQILNFVYKESEEVIIATLDDTIDNAEKDVIIAVLKEHQGNRTRAAEALGISRRSLHRKIAKYNIED